MTGDRLILWALAFSWAGFAVLAYGFPAPNRVAMFEAGGTFMTGAFIACYGVAALFSVLAAIFTISELWRSRQASKITYVQLQSDPSKRAKSKGVRS